MSATVDQLIAIKCPLLSADANKATWVETAQLSIDADCYGNKYNLAVALRACHDYTVSKIEQGAGAGAAGGIVSKREGDQSISFANNIGIDSSDAYLSLTAYGKELISIRNGSVARMGYTGCVEGHETVTFCCTS